MCAYVCEVHTEGIHVELYILLSHYTLYVLAMLLAKATFQPIAKNLKIYWICQFNIPNLKMQFKRSLLQSHN